MIINVHSSCTKKARKKTISIVSRYLNRVNNQSWNGKITLRELKLMRNKLSSSATKLTSIICIAIKKNSNNEIVFRVGSQQKYDENGNYTNKTIIQNNDPYIIKACTFAQASGIMHDIGKVTIPFQEKLIKDKDRKSSDWIRHEFISMLFVMHVIKIAKDKNDNYNSLNGEFLNSNWDKIWNFIESITKRISDEENTSISKILKDMGSRNLNVNQSELLYLIGSHHKLFSVNSNRSSYNFDSHVFVKMKKNMVEGDGAEARPYKPYRDEKLNINILNKIARFIKNISLMDIQDPRLTRFNSHLARIGLIAADHYISSIKLPKNGVLNCNYMKTSFAANTCKSKEATTLNQNLNWHLLNVSDTAGKMIRDFKSLKFSLPSILNKYDNKEDKSVILSKKFLWQNTAINKIKSWKNENPNKPILCFINAGTGSGKTIAGLKVGIAASGENARITSIFNLRTLTTQSCNEYRSFGYDTDIVLGDKNLLIEGLDYNAENNKKDSLLNRSSDDVYMDCATYNLPEFTSKITSGKKENKAIIASPLLVATADYIAHAGNPNDQRKHVLASLRCMNSTLIIDEIDSFGATAIASLCRIIEITASYGNSVIIQTATLTQPIANVIYKSFKDGYNSFSILNNLKGNPAYAILNNYIRPIIKTPKLSTLDNDFFVNFDFEPKINKVLNSDSVFRKTSNIECDNYNDCVNKVFDKILHMHGNHNYNNVSIGGIRILRHKRAHALTFSLLEKADLYMKKNKDVHIHIVFYSAKLLKSQRISIEKNLDSMLKRKLGNPSHPEGLLKFAKDKENKKSNNIFIVVATPVIDTGRDFDFDWGICDVTSMRSVVQFSGRINRHRMIPVNHSNLALLANPLCNIFISHPYLNFTIKKEDPRNYWEFYPKSPCKIDVFNNQKINNLAHIPSNTVVTSSLMQSNLMLSKSDIDSQTDVFYSNNSGKYICLPSEWSGRKCHIDNNLLYTTDKYNKYCLREKSVSTDFKVNNNEGKIYKKDDFNKYIQVEKSQFDKVKYKSLLDLTSHPSIVSNDYDDFANLSYYKDDYNIYFHNVLGFIFYK